MNKLEQDIRDSIAKITKTLGHKISNDCYSFKFLPPKHEPNKLPPNTMAIYIFKYENIYLKIGKVGLNSNSRFQFQHYKTSPHIGSSLAKSLEKGGLDVFSKKSSDISTENWIKENCYRIEILISANKFSSNKKAYFALSLIESILHYKYFPLYEGKYYESRK